MSVNMVAHAEGLEARRFRGASRSRTMSGAIGGEIGEVVRATQQQQRVGGVHRAMAMRAFDGTVPLGDARDIRERGDEARLPARWVDVLGRCGAGSFGPALWSTLAMTRRTAAIGV